MESIYNGERFRPAGGGLVQRVQRMCALAGVRVQKVQKVQRVLVAPCGRNIKKTFTTGLSPGENRQTVLRAREKPPLVAGATTFPPAKLGALWVLSNVPHDTRGKRRAIYSAP